METTDLLIRFTYLYFTVIETKGQNGHPRPLEEIAALFDGEQVMDDVAQSSEAAAADREKNMLGDGGMEGGFGDKKLDSAEDQHVEHAVVKQL